MKPSKIKNLPFGVGLTLKDTHKILKNKEITLQDLLKNTHLWQQKFEKYHFFVHQLNYDDAQLNNIIFNNFLAGVPYSAKDNFAVKNIKMSAGTLMLKDFIPPYNATVIDDLNQAQALVLNKTHMDELGMGGSGLFSAFKDVYNPYDIARITGGSSSGSAGAVAAGIVSYALGTDTGDSVRKPASYCGVVGFKPSYGLISRYGVVPYAPSLDTVAYFTRSIEDAAIILDQLAHHDHKDFTSVKSSEKQYFKNINSDVSGLKIAWFKNLNHLINPVMLKKYQMILQELKNSGAIIEEINFSEKLLGSLEPTYIIISYCEAVSCHANLDGINFSSQVAGKNYRDIILKTCSSNYHPIAKKRFIIGAYCLHKENQKLLVKAKKTRYLVAQALLKIFETYDAFLIPPTNEIAPLVKNIQHQKQYQTDGHLNYLNNILLLSNFLGNPSLTLPVGFYENMPFGININTNLLQEQTCLNIALKIETITKLKNLQVSNYHQYI